MTDVRSNTSTLIHQQSGEPILCKFINGRIETNHVVVINEDFSQFPTGNMPVLPEPGVEVQANTMYTDGTLNWNCIQTHIRTADDPINIPALFRQYRAQGQPWVQPIDQYDAYYTGDWVTHNGQSWTCTLEGTPNVWEPGVVNETFWAIREE